MTQSIPTTETAAELTPYDRGERLEPRPWVQPGTQSKNVAAYGRVDFDNEESSTALTVFVDRDRGDRNSYTLHIENVNVELSLAGDRSAPMTVVPSKELQQQVQHIIDSLRTPIEQEEAEVFWNYRQAVIIVPGEKHLRKQQVIMVTEGRGVLSAKVGSWGNGVRDRRIG